MAEETKKEVSEKFSGLIKEIEKLNVLELSELVKVLEDKFNVSAAMPVAVAPAAGTGNGAAGESEEKTAFDINLISGGEQKIQVIKAVRELTGKGLKESKDVVDKVPQIVKTGVTKAEAEEIKKKLEEAGATVEIK